MNSVELKNKRKALKGERKALVALVHERDLSEDEQAKFDEMSAAIDSLSSRIEALEKVESDESEEMDDEPEDAKPEAYDDKKENSRRSHLSFNVVSSKTRKDSHEYSITRALSQLTSNRPVDGLEGERSREIGLLKGTSNFCIPLDAPMRGRHRIKQRADFTTTTGTGAIGVNVQPTLIDLLRARMVTSQLGITMISDIPGKFALPRQTTAATYYFVGEASNVTNSSPVLDNVNFVPKTMGIRVLTNRKTLFETSVDALTLVENDIVKSFAVGLDATVLNGSGSGATPTGILQQSSVTTITLAADAGSGGALTYADSVAFETAVSAANADQGDMGWVTTPGVRGKLKGTPRIGSTFPVFTWSDDNKINGYDAYVTTNMPSTGTKGSGTALHAAIFGYWPDAVLAMWSGLEIVQDQYTQLASGGVVLQGLQEVDVQLRHGGSFACCAAISVA